MNPEYPVYGLLLAAGLSRRLPPNKLLLELSGKTFLARVAGAAVSSGLAATVAVLGHDSAKTGEVLKGFPCRTVFNPDYRRGMGYSVVCGVEYIRREFSPPPAAGVLLCLGDEPLITAALINRVIAAYRSTAGSIVIPVFSPAEKKENVAERTAKTERAGMRTGTRFHRGHPSVFPLGLISSALGPVRARGARELIRLHPERVREIEVPAAVAAGFDVDTPGDYLRIKAMLGKSG